jgi:hypothetical protein
VSVEIVFDVDWEDGPGEAFQLIVESLAGLLVAVAPADGGSAFSAVLVGGQNPNDHLDDEWLDEVRIQHVDDVDLEPVGEPEYVRVKSLRLFS